MPGNMQAIGRLSPAEEDFLDFAAERTGRSRGDIAGQYAALSVQYRFDSDGYRALCSRVYALESLLSRPGDEGALVASIQTHATLYLYRYLSYGRTIDRPKQATSLPALLALLVRGNWHRYRRACAARRSPCPDGSARSVATWLLSLMPARRVIVDYGCGLAYCSLEMAQLDRSAIVYLLDVDSLALDFAVYRFRRRGLPVETIRVTGATPYPELPPHALCIATEVMEHLLRPLDAYRNILSALEPGGLFYGNFGDHRPDPHHVSPDLGALRRRIEADFEKVGDVPYRNACYRRRPAALRPGADGAASR